MSEYQYYEFATLDASLSKAQQAELRACSTRARITAGGFINEYHWGDLKGDPFDWMQRYFEAHVYTSNWGRCCFMLRLPKDALASSDAGAATASEKRRGIYGAGAFSIHDCGDHWILDWNFDGEGDADERFYDADDGPGWMARLAPLREELLRGDARPLYLGWLARLCSCELEDGDREPSVPPGLRSLTPAQQALAEFLLLDPDLLAAAQAGSPAMAEGSQPDSRMDAWLEGLSVSQLRASAQCLLTGDAIQAARGLRNQYSAWLREQLPATGAAAARRTVVQIEAGRHTAEQARLQRERTAHLEREARQQAERELHLAGVAKRAGAIWKEVDGHLQAGTGAAYERAQQAVLELFAAFQANGREPEFRRALVTLLATHGQRRAWTERLRRVGLM